MIASSETGYDQLLHLAIPDRDSRGRMVRLGPVLDTILAAHPYPSVVKQLLAEALVVTALIGGLLKGVDDQLTLQAQTEQGVIELLVCDYRNGELRGHIRFDHSKLDDLGPAPSLDALFSGGYLAMTFDLAGSGQRYQGIVSLEGASLADACSHYFLQSEQIPTLIKVAVAGSREGWRASGLLLQHLPEGEEGKERLHVRIDHPEWEHVAAMAGSMSGAELLDDALSLEDLAWRLFHEEREIRVAKGARLSRGCRCSAAHYHEILSRFPLEDREEMRDDDGRIKVDCAFCSHSFTINL